MLAGSETELVEQCNPQARLAVVDAARCVERDQRVVIDMARIGIRCHPIIAHAYWAFELPGSGSDELLARDRRERIDDSARLNVSRKAQLLSVAAARHLHRYRHSGPSRAGAPSIAGSNRMRSYTRRKLPTVCGRIGDTR